MTAKTHGYERRSKVPALPRTTPKVCRSCDSWFAARPREAVCDGCVPPSVRTKRALQNPLLTPRTRTGSSVGKRAGHSLRNRTVRKVYSDILNLTFEAPLADPRSASLECLVLAYEAAAVNRRNR